MAITDCLTPAARDILIDLLYRNEYAVLIESHNRAAVHELQNVYMLSRYDGGDGPGREGWYPLTPTGESARNSLGVPGLQRRTAFTGVRTEDLRTAAEYFERRIAEGAPGIRSRESALVRVKAALALR